jgi:hypothetical protein
VVLLQVMASKIKHEHSTEILKCVKNNGWPWHLVFHFTKTCKYFTHVIDIHPKLDLELGWNQLKNQSTI